MKKELLDLFISIYSMPQWNALPKKPQEKQNAIKKLHEQLVNLHKLVKSLDASESQKISIPKVDKLKLFNYSSMIQSIKAFVIKQMFLYYKDEFTFIFVNKVFTECKNIHSTMPDKQLGTICEQLSRDITQKQYSNKHIEVIKELLKEKGLNNYIITENYASGANDGYIATCKNEKLFIKTFSESCGSVSEKTKKIDSRELFVYKVLEYTGFGPKTDCLLKRFSSSKGSTNKGNYIMTRDVAVIENDENQIEKRKFFRDGDVDTGSLSCYKQAMKNENFKIELFALACLNSILRLHDTFGDNTGNYGIVKTTMKNGSVTYTPKLIDHLPSANNAAIKEDYSPGTFLKKSFSIFSEKQTEKNSCMKDVIFSDKKNSENFRSMNMSSRVKNMVLNGKKPCCGIEEAIKKAKVYVNNLINKYNKCFTDDVVKVEDENGYSKGQSTIDAKEMIKIYMGRIQSNLETFRKNYGKKIKSIEPTLLKSKLNDTSNKFQY